MNEATLQRSSTLGYACKRQFTSKFLEVEVVFLSGLTLREWPEARGRLTRFAHEAEQCLHVALRESIAPGCGGVEAELPFQPGADLPDAGHGIPQLPQTSGHAGHVIEAVDLLLDFGVLGDVVLTARRVHRCPVGGDGRRRRGDARDAGPAEGADVKEVAAVHDNQVQEGHHLILHAYSKSQMHFLFPGGRAWGMGRERGAASETRGLADIRHGPSNVDCAQCLAGASKEGITAEKVDESRFAWLLPPEFQ